MEEHSALRDIPSMIVYTDSVAFGEQVAPRAVGPWTLRPTVPAGVEQLVDRLFGGRPRLVAAAGDVGRWPVLLALEEADRSQFDMLVALGREGVELPDGVVCLAGAGRGLHGQRGRAWAALAGNLHLSLWLAPPLDGIRSPIALLAMAAVSVVEAIDGLPGLAGRAGIKWVNDIMIGDAKVCGILTHVETRSTGIRGVLGIGLNVERAPEVAPTAFVRAATSLRAVASDPDACRLGPVLHDLLSALDRNYESLLRDGTAALFDRYRERSLVIGRDVAICEESADPSPRVIAEGRVAGIGPQLELLLEGHARPFTTGRLMLRAR